MMRFVPWDDPWSWGMSNCSRPSTRSPRRASWYTAALPIPPTPTTMTSYCGTRGTSGLPAGDAGPAVVIRARRGRPCPPPADRSEPSLKQESSRRGPRGARGRRSGAAEAAGARRRPGCLHGGARVTEVDRYDAIVIGSGQGGNPLAEALAGAGRRVAHDRAGARGRHLRERGLHADEDDGGERPDRVSRPPRVGLRGARRHGDGGHGGGAAPQAPDRQALAERERAGPEAGGRARPDPGRGAV